MKQGGPRALHIRKSLASVRHPFPTVPAAVKSIVFVDDEAPYTELMSMMLAHHLGCPVHSFTHPAQALAHLAGLDAAVIVTDYHMPQLDGIAFIREAAKLAPAAVFVMITGHNLAAEEDNLCRLGRLKGFLSKPFGWRILAEEIVRVWPDPASAPALAPGSPTT